VLEHVEPELITGMIQTMAAKTKKVLYMDIACYPTGKLFAEGPYAGKDLHLTVEDPDWWRATVKEALKGTGMIEFQYQWREALSKGGRKVRCLLIYERV
jgi:hypothetical protein